MKIDNKFFNDLKEIDSTSFIKVSSNSLFKINFNDSNENVINAVFKYIEDSKSTYNINKYTLSTTSLEDVFINLNLKEFPNQLLKIPQCIQVVENNEDKIMENNKVSIVNQFYGNFIKNVWVFSSHYTNYIGPIIMFIIFFSVLLIFDGKNNKSESLINNSKFYNFIIPSADASEDRTRSFRPWTRPRTGRPTDIFSSISKIILGYSKVLY